MKNDKSYYFQVSDANDMGKQAIDDLRTIIDYFEDFGSGGWAFLFRIIS